ncbi:MFS transporter [Tetragenococcus koreensis]|uniref:MFS transporter n=1 Tax=Tetragenococcus koreensis TaxID=290335 RepID=UPI000F4E107F|nr:MFS transporter [Tetragenococcus koreensis]AYW45441.1 permease [Tetragenococcus koreensis]GEN90528.1 permease [Tetragenococcus koreensis]
MFKFIRKNASFAQLASINLFSKTGDRLFYTAMLTLAASLPEANLAVMIVSISETLPVLLSFLLGSLADRRNNKIELLINNSFFRTFLYLFIGLLFNYSTTFPLVLCIAALNFVSDLSGNYSSALVAPFSKLLVQPKDMQRAQGIISITAQLVNIVATFAGSILLTFFIAGTIAYINAMLFFIVGISYIFIRSKLLVVEKELPTITEEKTTTENIKNNFKTLYQDKFILNDLCQLSLLNGVFGGLTPIFVIFIQNDNVSLFLSRPLTISLLSGLITIFMMVGNSISSNLFKNTPTSTLNSTANLFIGIVGVGFILNNLYIVLISSSFIALLLGIVSPRFTAKIVNNYPTEHLGGIVTTVNSLLVLTPPITSFIFPLFANIGETFAYLCFLFYGLLLILISFLILKKKAFK